MTPSKGRFPPDGARRKSVLYCPECGHTSPIGGDWHVEHAAGRERVVYTCPECGHVITTRFGRRLVCA